MMKLLTLMDNYQSEEHVFLVQGPTIAHNWLKGTVNLASSIMTKIRAKILYGLESVRKGNASLVTIR